MLTLHQFFQVFLRFLCFLPSVSFLRMPYISILSLFYPFSNLWLFTLFPVICYNNNKKNPYFFVLMRLFLFVLLMCLGCVHSGITGPKGMLCRDFLVQFQIAFQNDCTNSQPLQYCSKVPVLPQFTKLADH